MESLCLYLYKFIGDSHKEAIFKAHGIQQSVRTSQGVLELPDEPLPADIGPLPQHRVIAWCFDRDMSASDVNRALADLPAPHVFYGPCEAYEDGLAYIVGPPGLSQAQQDVIWRQWREM